MTRILNCMFGIAIFVGLFLYIQQYSENRLLQREIDRLVDEVGLLEPNDVQTPRLITITSDDSMLFRWRLYLPAHSPGLKTWEVVRGRKRGSSSGGGGSKPSEILLTAKFEMTNGELGCYLRFSNWSRTATDGIPDYRGGAGGGRDRIARGKAALFLRDHWDELQISVFESNGRSAIDLDKPIQILEINIPEHLYSKLSKAAADDVANGSYRIEDFKIEPFFRLTIGSKL